MIYLFDNNFELLEGILPLSAVMNRRIKSAERLSFELPLPAPAFDYVGHWYKGKFYIYSVKQIEEREYSASYEAVSYAFDELKYIKIIEDLRPADVSAGVAITSALQGTGWMVNEIEASALNSTNFYFISPLDAIKKVVEIWGVEVVFHFGFDGKNITGRYVDVVNRLGSDTGERHVYGVDLVDPVRTENREGVVTALYGRGKGAEILDAEGNPTGTYGRRIDFADVVTAYKPAGQEYVELPELTNLYGLMGGVPRFGVVIFDDETDPVNLLNRTYSALVEASRPLMTFETSVAEAGAYNLGDSRYIIRPDLGFSYSARIFEDSIDLLYENNTSFKFGDYIESSQVKRAKEFKKIFESLEEKITSLDENVKGEIIKVSTDWYDALMEAKEGTFFSGNTYNYSLEAGNEYGLPAGFYSFDHPLDDDPLTPEPTSFLVIRSGMIGRGSVLPDGSWDFNMIGDGSGLTADAITAGKVKAQFVEIGSSSTFLSGYDPSAKAESSDVYTKTDIDTKFTVVDGQITSSVSTREVAIVKQNTAPPHSAGVLWLDTSVVPNVLKRSTGIEWIKATPTTAGEVGAFSSADGSGVLSRLSAAELKITPEAITGTVEDTVDLNGSTVLATRSYVEQTSDAWTAKFEEIGGSNLIENSDAIIRSGWVAFDGSALTVSNDQTVSDWGTVKAVRVAATAGGGTSVIKGYLQIFGLKPELDGEAFTFSLYVKNNSANGAYIGTNSFGLPEYIAPSEIKRVAITGAMIGANYTQIQLRSSAVGVGLDVTLWRPQIERGYVMTDWRPHADELYTGITKITKDGVNVGVSSSQTNTQMSYDGLRVYDGTAERAYFGESGSFIPELSATNIIANVDNIIDDNIALDVGSGRTYGTVTEALASLGSKRNIQFNKTVLIEVYGSISDEILINSFTGTGSLKIHFNGTTARLNGSISAFGNTCRISIYSDYGANGTIKRASTTSVIALGDNKFVEVSSMNLDGTGLSTSVGITASGGTKLAAYNCDIANVQYGIHSAWGGTVHAYDNKGNASAYGYRATYAGFFAASGTCPNGVTGSHVSSQGIFALNGTLTETNSGFTTPPTTPTVFSSVFKPSKLETYNRTEGYISSYYGSTAAQGKYTGMAGWLEGRITFGTNVANYWQGGYNISVQMRLHRKDSTHGLSSAVKPDPDNFLAGGSTTWPTAGALRGGWSEWASVASSEFSTTASKEFRFYSGVLDSGYAIWDDAEVKVTVTKDI